jgi:hypothetical protein
MTEGGRQRAPPYRALYVLFQTHFPAVDVTFDHSGYLLKKCLSNACFLFAKRENNRSIYNFAGKGNDTRRSVSRDAFLKVNVILDWIGNGKEKR